MSETLRADRAAVVGAVRRCSGWSVLALSLGGLCIRCRRMSTPTTARWRSTTKRPQEKAKMDAITLENETKVLATTGDYSKLKRTQRSLSRIKDWEEKCEKEAKRFEKAAEWTEAHFHLEKPPIPDSPPGYRRRPGPGCAAGVGGQGSLN